MTVDAHGRTRAQRQAQRDRIRDAALRRVDGIIRGPFCGEGGKHEDCRRESPRHAPELPSIGCLCECHDPEELS